MKKLTDRAAVRLALYLAIDYENSLIDAYRNGYVDNNGVYHKNAIHPDNFDTTNSAAQNVEAFKRVLERYYGEKYTPFKDLLLQAAKVN